MKTIELAAEERTITTQGALRTLRQAGRIPSVVYGGSKEPVSIVVDTKSLTQGLKGHGTNVLVNLKTGTNSDIVLLKDVQRDVLTHAVIHVDFQRISMTKKLEVNVPLHVVGVAPGVKLGGGILEHILREVRVFCLPTDIPDGISVDVSQLQLNQGLKVKDLVLPKGVEVLSELEGMVLSIVAPPEEEVVAPVAATAAAPGSEPEVIAKGKKPEEGETAAPAAKEKK